MFSAKAQSIKFSEAPESNKALAGRLLTIALTTVAEAARSPLARNMVPDVLATMAEDRSDNSLDSSTQAAEEVFRKERLLRQTFEK